MKPRRRTFKLKLVLAFFLVSHLSRGQQFTISTVAGFYSPGNTPTGAQDVIIGAPQGIATDSKGDIYFSSALRYTDGTALSQSIVLRIDSNGILTRVAGNPLAGYSGDGGPATSAMLNGASGLALDKSGNLYIADTANDRIRKVSTNGTITTVAGNGTSGYSGDGGPATSAILSGPGQIAVDSNGNLYIGDLSSARIREVTADGTIKTIAGKGTPGYSGDGGPAASAQLGTVLGMAVDPAGDLYFSDSYTYSFGSGDDSYQVTETRVRKISPQGIITTVAGNGTPGYSGDGGPAVNATLAPAALTLDSAGNLYIGDSQSQRIRKVSPSGTITTFAGSGTFSAPLDGVPALEEGGLVIAGLAVDAGGNMYIAFPGDSDALGSGSRIFKISEGIIFSVAGQPFTSAPVPVNPNIPLGDGGLATLASLDSPFGVAAMNIGLPADLLYVSDTADQRLRSIAPQGTIGTPAVPVVWPAGLLVDSSNNLYIADSGNGKIRMLSRDGTLTTIAGSGGLGSSGFSGDGGPATSARLSWPRDMAFDSNGNMYIADTANECIRMVDSAGIITTIAGNPCPSNGTGCPGYAGDGGPAINALFRFPTGLAVDSANNLYITDYGNSRVRKISTSGTITTIAGTGVAGYSGDGGMAVNAQLTYPTGLRFDTAGNLYIADGGSVRRISPDGTITTVAGTGVIGYTGDGGPAASAQIGAWGLAFDTSGNLYVSDPWNNVIRMLQP